MADLYYQPRRTQYKSQYVPMPLDFMQKALETKQVKWDQQQELLDTLADTKFNALPGEDRKRVRELEKEIQDFVDDSVGRDLGSSEYARDFKTFQRKIKNDKDLKKITAAYDSWQEVQELKKEWQKKGKSHLLLDVFGEAERAYRSYIGGEGFRGDRALIDSEDILPGVKKLKDSKEFFEHVSEDQVVDIITGEVVKGKSREKLTQIGDSLFVDWSKSAPGVQYAMVFDNNNLDSFGVVNESELDNTKKKHKVVEIDANGNEIEVVDPETGEAIMETDYEYYTRHKDNWLKDTFRDIALSYANEKLDYEGGSGGSGQNLKITGGGDLETVQHQVQSKSWDEAGNEYKERATQLNGVNEELDKIERLQNSDPSDLTPQEVDYLKTVTPNYVQQLESRKYDLEESQKQHTGAVAQAMKSFIDENNVTVTRKNEDGSYTKYSDLDYTNVQWDHLNALKENETYIITNEDTGEQQEVSIRDIWDKSQEITKEQMFEGFVADDEEGLSGKELAEKRRNDSNYKKVKVIPTNYDDPATDEVEAINLQMLAYNLDHPLASQAAKAQWAKRVAEYNSRQEVLDNPANYVKVSGFTEKELVEQNLTPQPGTYYHGYVSAMQDDADRLAELERIEGLSDKEVQIMYLERQKKAIQKDNNRKRQAAIDRGLPVGDDSIDLDIVNAIDDMIEKLLIDNEVHMMTFDPVKKAELAAHYNKNVVAKSNRAWVADKAKNRRIVHSPNLKDGAEQRASADQQLENLLIADGLKNDTFIGGDPNLQILSGGTAGAAIVQAYKRDENDEKVLDENGNPIILSQEVLNYKVEEINNVSKTFKDGVTPVVEGYATYETITVDEDGKPKTIEHRIPVTINATTPGSGYKQLKADEFLSDYYVHMHSAGRSTGAGQQRALQNANKAMSNYIQVMDADLFNDIERSGMQTMRPNTEIPFSVDVLDEDGYPSNTKLRFNIKKTETGGYIVTPTFITREDDGTTTKEIEEEFVADSYAELANIIYNSTDTSSDLFDEEDE